MRRPDEPLCHRGSRLDGDELIPEGFIKTAAKLPEGLGEHTVDWGGIDLILAEATRIPHGKVGPQALANLLIGGAQFMLEPFQRQQDADGHRPSTPWGFFRKPCVKTLRAGAHQSHPGKSVGPLTERMHEGYKISNLPVGSGTAQPMLKIANQAHRWLSCCKKERDPQDTTLRSTAQG